jgi:dTDP-4-dehydrorhamnose reductase
MKILVTGGRGQLGRSVVVRGRASGHDVWAPDVDELDICDAAQTARVAGHDLVINAAAYTAVDKAETEREKAFAINRDGAGHLARACAERGIRFLHVSTDYVFDGTGTRPYREDDPIAPLGVYGASKAEGEQAVHEAGGTVVRTSWLFAEGGPSFVHTMLRLAKERPVLRVVADQRGCPTYAGDLADALIALVPGAPTYHYSNAGETTWHEFATAIIAQARTLVSLACERIDAITTAEYPTPARRPAYSVLDTQRIRDAGIVPPPWQAGLARVVAHALEH